jgi:hypothetical protein
MALRPQGRPLRAIAEAVRAGRQDLTRGRGGRPEVTERRREARAARRQRTERGKVSNSWTLHDRRRRHHRRGARPDARRAGRVFDVAECHHLHRMMI